MGLDVVGLADGLDLKEVERVFDAEFLGQLDVGVERDDAAVPADVAHRVVCFGVVVLGVGIDAVQIVQAGRHPGVVLVVIGGVPVDDVRRCIAHESPGLLCDGDGICRCDDVIRVVEIDLADGRDVRLHKYDAVRKLEGDVGVARQVLDEPRLILVADEYAGTTGCTGVFIDGCQQGDAFAGRACLAE